MPACRQVLKYLFASHPGLWEACTGILRAQPGDVSAEQLLDLVCQQVRTARAISMQ